MAGQARGDWDHEDWRLQAELDVAEQRPTLDRLLEHLRPPAFLKDIQSSVPHDVVITHDGKLLFAYAADEATLEAGDHDAETVETRTLVVSSGKMIRAEFERSLREWAEKLGVQCTIVEHPHLLRTQVGFTVTGPRRKLEEFAEGLSAEEWATIRTERAVMMSPL
jgi:hypothetical protein